MFYNQLKQIIDWGLFSNYYDFMEEASEHIAGLDHFQCCNLIITENVLSLSKLQSL